MGRTVISMSDNNLIFSEADEKTIRDTVNKQRRLIELYNMRSMTSPGSITSEQLQHIVASSQAISNLIVENASGHQAATMKAATSLMGAMMVARMTSDSIVAAAAAQKKNEQKASKPAKAAPKKAAPAAKKA
jgi:hypothetical protein